MKRILFVATESVPFIKTGGLGEVVGSLPKEINRSQYDVRVVIPKYRVIPDKYKEKMRYVTHFWIDLSWRRQYVGVFEMKYGDVHFYFVDNEFYFSGVRPYSAMFEDFEKFAFFCKASLSILPSVGFKPDIIHCHDWQTALIPVFLKEFFSMGYFFSRMKTVFTIHNIAFQGKWDMIKARDISGLNEKYFTVDGLEAYGAVNCLKGGVVFSDKVTTVSGSYADEIKTGFYGKGLDGLMRAYSHKICGIVNGIDFNVFDPMHDEFIAYNYNRKTYREGKRVNKLDLQHRLGLRESEDAFLIGIVSRLTRQKGLDLIDCVFDEMLGDNDTQVVILGDGDENYVNMFHYYAYKYPGRVSVNAFNEELAHKVFAGVDACLMPSLFEPCGLSQLMGLRYGAIPVVRGTGGLRDTVEPYNEYEKCGTGFAFDNYNAHEMLGMINYARSVFRERKTDWNMLVSNAMAKDHSWKCSAEKYQELYDSIIS